MRDRTFSYHLPWIFPSYRAQEVGGKMSDPMALYVAGRAQLTSNTSIRTLRISRLSMFSEVSFAMCRSNTFTPRMLFGLGLSLTPFQEGETRRTHADSSRFHPLQVRTRRRANGKKSCASEEVYDPATTRPVNDINMNKVPASLSLLQNILEDGNPVVRLSTFYSF